MEGAWRTSSSSTAVHAAVSVRRVRAEKCRSFHEDLGASPERMQMLRTEFPQDVPSGRREWAAKQRKKAWIQADFMRLPELDQGSRSRGPSRGSRGVREHAGKVPTSSAARLERVLEPMRARDPERVFPLCPRTDAAGARPDGPASRRAPAAGRLRFSHATLDRPRYPRGRPRASPARIVAPRPRIDRGLGPPYAAGAADGRTGDALPDSGGHRDALPGVVRPVAPAGAPGSRPRARGSPRRPP